MPTYQYACTGAECGSRFELVQSFTDPAVSECPVCAGAVRKVYGSVGVVFKGSGFYRNDSRAAAKAAESSSKSSSDSANSDSKSDSKSDTKSEPKSASNSGSKSDTKPAAKSAPAAASA